jgi:serine/threonine-protein kinase
MEYVPGTSLEQRVAQGALPSREAARYVLEVARALHFAHDKGILHRDLKPANILVDPENRPKLTDFGLAKMLATPQADQAASTSLPKGELTRTGAVMGTPSYMAPEQASGDTKQIGPATDVYGLGAVLYELLTGRPPFKGESQVETILQVLNQDPVPPRLSNPNVDVDLETICLKCLEKDPQLRYASAEALAADLHRYLSDEPITARSVNVLERLTRVLTYSQHDKELKKWGLGLMLFGVIVLFAHTASSFLLAAGQPDTISFWGPRTVEIMLLGLVLWFFRDHALWPTSQAQRLIWATWVGYLVAHFVLSLVLRQFGHPHQHIYALSAALTGMAFCVMGCHVWGGCYVIALAFFVTAPILAMFRESDWSPLWFGVMWSAALVVVGMRYYRLGQVAAAQHQAAPAAPKGG